ncbi:MAG TPA: TonB family protein [Terriglobales bacterium]|nr:TonB family protein [Terriglobales bacterium]
MANLTSGIPLPSRDAQEFSPGRPWTALPSEQTDATNAKASLALAILSEKIKSGAMRRTELMQRIAAQALTATAAKGVALALRSYPGGPVVCCASEGDMAPPPGTPLDESSGFTAECLRKGTFIVCEDAETDPRVDRVACACLGVRSIVAVPVENEGATVGVLEALSDQQAAFSKQHIEVLLTLACFTKSVVVAPEAEAHVPAAQSHLATPAFGAETVPVQAEAILEPDLFAKIEDNRIWSGKVPRRVRLAIVGGVAAALLLALFATAILLWMWRQNANTELGKTAQPQPSQQVYSKPPAAGGRAPSLHGSPVRLRTDGERKSVLSKASAVERLATAEPARAAGEPAPVSAPEEDAVAPAPFTPLGTPSGAELNHVLSSGETLPTAAVPTSQGATPARLQHRVEPVYPADAKRLRIEGPVVLRATIDDAGNVKSVRLVNGNPLLANAALAAVRQWHYAPSELNHRPTASTTDITIMFRLQ